MRGIVVALAACVMLPSLTSAKVARWPESAEEPVIVVYSDVDVENPKSEGAGVGVVVGDVAIAGGETEFVPGSHVYFVRARNVSHKKITAVEFAFEFYTPFGERYGTQYIQSSTVRRVGAWGAKAYWAVRVHGEGVRHKQDTWHHKVRPSRVMFDDGTTWVSPTNANTEP